jgi:uncharacterized small protein (DUF1192 family)
VREKALNFLFSVPTGEPVAIEPFHFAIIGQTQFSGKTTLIKRLSEWAVSQGFKVLVFDSKETEADYSGFGRDVPVCLRETTDSFVLIGLLESMFKRRLTPYYATLSRLTEGARGFNDIIARARELEARTRSSWLRDACRVLYDLLERLQTETSRVETVPELKLHDGINRMAINNFTLEAQQLIIKNAFEDALRVYKSNLILVLDEAFKYLPEKWSSAATRAVMNVITQGAKTGLYVWLASQFLAVTDKDPLKACAVKFLGTQDHITEVKHTLDLIPEARGKFTADDIMKLKLGHWVLVRKRPPLVGIVYSLPVGVPEEVGVDVAKGIRTPESVRDEYLKPKLVEVDQELVWKEKYEEEHRIRKEFEKRLGEYSEQVKLLQAEIKTLEAKIEEARQEAYRDAMQKLDELKKQWNIEEYQKTIMMLKDEKATLEAELKKLEPLKAFGEALTKFLAECSNVRVAGFEPAASMPSEVSVAIQQPTLTIQKRTPPLSLDDSSLEGKIAIVYAEGELPKDKWFSVSDVTKAFQRHGWKQDPRTSSALDKFCQWGYFVKQMSGKRPDYRIKLDVEEAKKRGLLRILEVES